MSKYNVNSVVLPCLALPGGFLLINGVVIPFVFVSVAMLFDFMGVIGSLASSSLVRKLSQARVHQA